MKRIGMQAMMTALVGWVLVTAARGEPDGVNAEEHQGVATLKGKAVTLLGRQIAAGDAAPLFKVVDAAFQPVTLSEFKGKVVLISAVPSLDTNVCSIETRRFNEEAARLPGSVVMLTISTDLPFAQKRFCEAERIDRLRVLSDAVWRDFGLQYGVLIQDRGLLARAIFVIDREGVVRYVQRVREISHEPDYDAALSALRAVAGS